MRRATMKKQKEGQHHISMKGLPAPAVTAALRRRRGSNEVVVHGPRAAACAAGDVAGELGVPAIWADPVIGRPADGSLRRAVRHDVIQGEGCEAAPTTKRGGLPEGHDGLIP